MKGTIGLVAVGVGCLAASQAIGAPTLEAPILAAPAGSATAGVLPPSTPGGLTSAEVARRAESTSPVALAQHEAVAAAQARLDQVTVAYYPRLALVGRYTRYSPVDSIPLSGNANGPLLVFLPDAYLLTAGLNVPISDYILRLSHAHAAATQSVNAAKLDERAARLLSSVNGRVVYYGWLRARAQVAVSQQALENARGHLTDARNSFEAGTVSKADVLAVEAEVANAELVLARSQTVSQVTEEQLRVTMHDASNRPYEVGEDLGADVSSPLLSASFGNLWSEALTKRLEIRSLEMNASAAHAQASAAKASYYPNLSAFGDIIGGQPHPRLFFVPDQFKVTWDVGAQITWSPNDALLGGGVHAESQARAAQIEAQKLTLIDSVRVELMQAYQAMQEAQVSIQTSTRGQVAAEESYRVRRELFKNGRATSVELTDAELSLRNANLNAINARANLRAALAQLEHASGRDVRE